MRQSDAIRRTAAARGRLAGERTPTAIVRSGYDGFLNTAHGVDEDRTPVRGLD